MDNLLSFLLLHFLLQYPQSYSFLIFLIYQLNQHNIGDVIAMSDEKIPTDEFTLVHESEPWKKQVITDTMKKEGLAE